MPGILPMKVIKVGSSSQSRIAQACDRCRSKKIRCDGIRPCCSQCANVGFECRTSDKLSRRAFPRGYTESLEERVRQLESEVRELKDLLDEKDEKIDMLSKMHGNRRQSVVSVASTPASDHRKEQSVPPKEDTFRVHASPLLLGVENSDSYFMGGSSGRSFIEFFKRKIQERGTPCLDFNPEAFLHIQGCYPLTAKTPDHSLRIPPRLFSDRCVSVYFQEWAPLFPVLHKPSFLRIYEEFVTDPEKVKSHHKIAQLYLVFGIASLSSDQPDIDQIAVCEQQWQKSVEAIIMDNTMISLQCLVLALIYCTVRADYKRLQHYKGVAIGLSHRLGLHQSQKRFSFGALTIETRKKVFWTLYTLDCFSAAILGLPKLMKEEDVHAEYPADTDDEYVTEKGFQPTLPGESTRLSSALALFRLCRVLSKVLEKNYPSASSHELCLQQLDSLDAELDEWSEALPNHLRLNFVQDKPSTEITTSRSPLLALAYYYTRTLVHRPAIGSTLGPKAAPAMISIGDSSKHIVQIIQLLEERTMTFSFCLNKTDVLVLCGFALLYQVLDLKEDSKLLKDIERLVNVIIKILNRTKAPGSFDFKRISGMLITLDEPALPTPPRHSPEQSMPAPSQRTSPPVAALKKKMHHQPFGRLAAATVSETDLLQQQEKLRRMTMPVISSHRPEAYRPQPRASLDASQEHMARRDPRLSVSRQSRTARRPSPLGQRHNLDYLALSSSAAHTSAQARARLQPQRALTQPQPQSQSYNAAQTDPKFPAVSAAEMEALFGSMEGVPIGVYDPLYGGQGLTMMETPASTTSTYSGWSPDSWDLSSFSIGDFGRTAAGTQSIVSMSDDSISSGEEVPSSELGIGVSEMEYRNTLLSAASCTNGEAFAMEGNFGL